MQEMSETWVWSLSWEDSLEKGMATHSTILVWEIPWTEEPDRLPSMGSQNIRHNWVTEYNICCTVSLKEVTRKRNFGNGYTGSMYYFLLLYVNLQLSQNKGLFKKVNSIYDSPPNHKMLKNKFSERQERLLQWKLPNIT